MASEQELNILVRLKDEASAQLAQMNTSLVSLSRAWVSSYGAIAAAITGGITALVANAVSVANLGREIKNMSIETGFGLDSISQLKYVAELSGKSLGEVGLAIRMMARSLQEAENPGSNAAKALRELGISMQELQSLSPEDRFYRIAEAISDVADPTQRAALAIDVFGRSGTAILPIIDDLNTKMAEASKHALIFTSEDQANARAFDVAIQGLRGEWDKTRASFASMTFEAFTPLISGLANVLNFLNEIESKSARIGDVYASANAWLNRQVGIAQIQSLLELSQEAQSASNTISQLNQTTDSYESAADGAASGANSLANSLSGIGSSAQSAAQWMRELVNAATGGNFESVGNRWIPIGSQMRVRFGAYAEGGIVTKPTLGLVGEAGPEAIVPLNRAGGMGGVNVTVNVGGIVNSGQDLAALVRREILWAKDRNYTAGLA